MISEVPRTIAWWAKRWKVHRHTARKLLKHLHSQYGAKVVWYARFGRHRSPVATEASLQVVTIMRAERNLILVLDRNQAQAQPISRIHASENHDYVTQEQLSHAIQALRADLAEHKRHHRG
jgi:hypothetical protein